MERNKNKQYTPGSRSSRSRRRRKKHGTVFKVIITIVLIAVITIAMLLCMSAVYIKTVIMPDADLQLTDYSMNLTTTMFYKDPQTGQYKEQQTLYGNENRVWVTLEEIPKDLMNAAVAIEDKRFYDHHGVDWVRTINGILLMFSGGDIQGGSTITQQLIKNLTDEDEVTVKRKITEIFRALEFEENYSKEDILEWYLNYIYLGEGCNGVYTASYAYFGKHVSELSLAECASLIGITNNPSKYDPYAKLQIKDETTGEVKTAKDFNKQRQEIILNEMYKCQMITRQQLDEAIKEELHFVRGQDDSIKTKTYTWYEDAVISDVIADLQETYNWSEEAAKQQVFAGGLQIYTCMNPDIQAAVDKIYGDVSNLNYTSSTGQQMQSAITVVDNKTGNVVALAGGVGEKTSSRSWNRATQSLRPPGSAIKPLSVYAPAIELGYITPASTVEDSPYKKAEAGGKPWPVNATGRYQGTVSIAKAVRESINTVAVKVLAEDVTPEVSYEFMQDKFHIKLVESRSVGDTNFTDIALAPLALGGLTDGVSTYEMAAAYSVFPRQGVYIPPRTYAMVVDSSSGEVLLDNTADEEEALSARTAYYMNDMLQQVVSGGPGATGTRANFEGQDVAGKTGTTTSRKDLWFAGYTPYYTAAVWTGYDMQEQLADGLRNPSADMWRMVMQEIHKSLPYKAFDKPEDGKLKTVTYCAVSGKLPGPGCAGHLTTGEFFAEDVPTERCDVHRVPAAIRPNLTPSAGVGHSGGHSGGGGTGGTPAPKPQEPAVPETPAPPPETEAPPAETPAPENSGEP